MSYFSRSDLILNLKGGIANQFYAFSAYSHLIKHYNLAGTVNISSLLSKDNPRDFGLLKLFSVLGIDGFRQTQFVSKPYLPYLSKLIERIPFAQSLYRTRIEDDQSSLPLIRSFNRKYLMDSYYIRHSSIVNGGLLSNYSPIQPTNFNSIAIHFRLGDYLNPKNRFIYPIITKDYLYKAFIQIISHPLFDHTLPLQLDIFSDSPEKAFESVDSIDFGRRVHVQVVSSHDPVRDLLGLASYPYKILSASTYSLLSYYLGHSLCTVIPSNWFLDRETSTSIFPPVDFKGQLYLFKL